MLLQGESYDDDDLCYDLVEICHAPSERSGLIVWGDPWNARSWEVTEEFATKWWWWMLRGCDELLYSTDCWRDLRGQEKLFSDASMLGFESSVSSSD
jgi:hypothetical protein